MFWVRTWVTTIAIYPRVKFQTQTRWRISLKVSNANRTALMPHRVQAKRFLIRGSLGLEARASQILRTTWPSFPTLIPCLILKPRKSHHTPTWRIVPTKDRQIDFQRTEVPKSKWNKNLRLKTTVLEEHSGLKLTWNRDPKRPLAKKLNSLK